MLMDLFSPHQPCCRRRQSPSPRPQLPHSWCAASEADTSATPPPQAPQPQPHSSHRHLRTPSSLVLSPHSGEEQRELLHRGGCFAGGTVTVKLTIQVSCQGNLAICQTGSVWTDSRKICVKRVNLLPLRVAVASAIFSLLGMTHRSKSVLH